MKENEGSVEEDKRLATIEAVVSSLGPIIQQAIREAERRGWDMCREAAAVEVCGAWDHDGSFPGDRKLARAIAQSLRSLPFPETNDPASTI
jgi:hypothetical protein